MASLVLEKLRRVCARVLWLGEHMRPACWFRRPAETNFPNDLRTTQTVAPRKDFAQRTLRAPSLKSLFLRDAETSVRDARATRGRATPLALATLLLATTLHAQDDPPTALGWDGDKQSRFPTSLAADHAGAVWVGTEGDGIWRHAGGQWTQFTTKDGLGDDYCYALAVDAAGRVWAGHLRSGVSVWNGEKWRNYGLLDGPIGDHVFALAVSPLDGDVWIATDAGLTRWRAKADTWDDYTRAAGLPADQVQALAFLPDGTLYAGMQCEGVAIASPLDNYGTWSTIPGPRFPRALPAGAGLPSNMINAGAVLRDRSGIEGVVFATPAGMASIVRQERDGHEERTVGFIRGENWAEIQQGLFLAAGLESDNSEGSPRLMEDWTTALALASDHTLWIGHRLQAAEALSFDAGGERVAKLPDGWVRAFLISAAAPPMAAIYGPKDGGLIVLPPVAGALPDAPPLPAKEPPPFPAPAKPPTPESILALTKHLAKAKAEIEVGDGLFLGDDWRTQGDWVGRYGREFAVLPGADKEDHEFISREGCSVAIGIGPHQTQGGPFRYTHRKATDDARILYNPRAGTRRDSEITDGSWNNEAYPWSWEGPDLLFTVAVPEGMHRVSFYMVNNDGHTGLNMYRDHEIELWPGGTNYETMSVPENNPLARARVRDFYAGVYKQFAVRGEGEFVFRIRRNHSHGTKIQGVFIDPLPLTQPDNVAGIDYAPFDLSRHAMIQLEGKPSIIFPARDLLTALDAAWAKRSAIGLQWAARLGAYRAAVAADAPDGLLANWRWQLGIWLPEDRAAFQKAMSSKPEPEPLD